jgi:hypothetical protein
VSSFTAHGQDLLSPAKYYVYKITFERIKANDLFPTKVGEWNVNMVFITGPEGGRIFQTVATKEGRTTVGAPPYLFLYKKHFRRRFDNGVSSDPYDIYYQGEVIPPKTAVQDPGPAYMVWRSAVTGEKSLHVMWDNDAKVLDKEGRPVFFQNRYELTFHCALVE